MILLVVVLMTVLMIGGTASANSWGLKGKLLNAVMKDHTWDVQLTEDHG